MKIHIESLSLSCIIGLLPFERETKQRVIVDIEIEYSYTQDIFINYADVSTLVKSHLIESKYLLLEDALLGIKKMLLLTYTNIENLYLKLSKPDILSDCTVALSDSWSIN